MPISPNFSSVLYKDFEINFLQCFPNGTLKYTELCNLFQLTAATHAELGGISFTDMQQFNQAWVLSKMRIEIEKLPKWKDKVTVKTWIKNLENSRSTRCLELYLDEKKIASCETFWAVFNTTSRKPEPLALPHEHFEKYPYNSAINGSLNKIDMQQSLDRINIKKVKLSDLDIVNHANSVKYIEWCLDELNAELIFNSKIIVFEMNYLKEISINDEICIAKNENTFLIYKQNIPCFAMKLEYKN